MVRWYDGTMVPWYDGTTMISSYHRCIDVSMSNVLSPLGTDTTPQQPTLCAILCRSKSSGSLLGNDTVTKVPFWYPTSKFKNHFLPRKPNATHGGITYLASFFILVTKNFHPPRPWNLRPGLDTHSRVTYMHTIGRVIRIVRAMHLTQHRTADMHHTYDRLYRRTVRDTYGAPTTCKNNHAISLPNLKN